MQEEIGRLVRESEDLGEFLKEACRVIGKPVTVASVEAGLSPNGFTSYISGRRRPSATTTYRLARYFGVPQAQIMRLAGLEVAGVDEDLLEGLTDVVRNIMLAMDAKELNEWIQYGEMLLLWRERRMRVDAEHGEIERESD
jgi:transcriptional regulator with XRE-family HTH domain